MGGLFFFPNIIFNPPFHLLFQVLCSNPLDPLCVSTGTTYQHCAIGGGNCNGYSSSSPASVPLPGFGR